MPNAKTDEALEEKLRSAYGTTWEKEGNMIKLKYYKKLVLKCCQKKDLVSVVSNCNVMTAKSCTFIM